MSDNFHIDVRTRGLAALKAALTIAFSEHRKIQSYRVDPVKGMIFYWVTEGANRNTLPFILDGERGAEFAHRWLEETAEYPAEPDHDGSNSKGWRVYTDAWGSVNGEDYSVCAVQPFWMAHGK